MVAIILFTFLTIAEYGELIAAVLAFLLLGAGIIRTWSKFAFEIDGLKTQFVDLRKTEKENHLISINRIEEMRKERHNEILELKAELMELTKENRKENAREHEVIKETLKVMGETLAEIKVVIGAKRKTNVA